MFSKIVAAVSKLFPVNKKNSVVTSQKKKEIMYTL